jgi:AcrR family transcriptional regulator
MGNEYPEISRHNSGRPTRDAAALLATKIIDTARELLLENGFDRTSINQVAERAGVTKRTIYVKVGDKEALLTAVVDDVLRSARGKLADPGLGAPTRDRLVAFGNSLVALSLEPDILRLYGLMLNESRRFPFLAARLQARFADSSVLRLTAIFDEEVAAGRLVVHRPEQTARLLAFMVLGDPQRSALLDPEPMTAQECRDWVEGAIDLFLRGHQPT